MNLVVASRSGRICVCENKTGTGEAGFGFLEFGDVDGSDVEATGFDAGACARERCRENDRVREGQGIGCMRLGGIDVDPFMTDERRGAKPCTVRQERVAAEMRDGRFQMQAAGDGNGDDFIVVRSKNGGQLADAFGVGAPGKADKELTADLQDVPTFKRARKRNVFELSKLSERLSERRRFPATGLRSER